MSFIETKILNPHLLLHALSLPPLNSQHNIQLKRLNLLARTRRFDDIIAASAEVKDYAFPTLAKSIEGYSKDLKRPRRRARRPRQSWALSASLR